MHPRGPSFFFWEAWVVGEGKHLVFSESSQCVPNDTSVLSHMLCPRLSSFHLYRWAKRQVLLLPVKTLFWGASKASFFFVAGQSK